MDNKDFPAYPFLDQGKFISYGLSKREWFAGMALTGYASAGSTGMPSAEDLARYAFSAADKLLEALNKSKETQQSENSLLRRALRSLMLSVMAHPDYTGEDNDEWTDLIELAEDALKSKEE